MSRAPKSMTPANLARRDRLTAGRARTLATRSTAKPVTGDAGRRAERETADRLQVRLTHGSGAGDDKGDFVVGDFMVEHKSTARRSITLQRSWLDKVTEQATTVGKTPALALLFTDEQGGHYGPGSWVAIPEALFAEVVRLIARERAAEARADGDVEA